MSIQNRDKEALKLFLVLTITTSILVEGIYIVSHNLTEHKSDLITILLMWVPGLAGIITSKTYYKKKNVLGIRPTKFKYLLLAILIPIIYLAVSYKIAWMTLGNTKTESLAHILGYPADSEIPSMLYIGISLFLYFIIGCITALGEELGWRGFLYPILERTTGKTKALIFSGFLWAGWHMPLIIANVYQSETTFWYGIPLFTIEVTLIGIILAWLRTITDSVLPAVVLHASHNLFDQKVFQPMSTNNRVAYYAGEKGIFTAIFVAIIAGIVIYFWKRTVCYTKNK